MREQTFANLEEFNKYLQSMDASIPPVTADMLPGYEGGPFTAVVMDKGNTLFAEESEEPTEISKGVAEPTVTEPEYNDREQQLLAQLEATLRVSTHQLALVMSQRDAEIEDHEACHAEFDQTYTRDVYAARIKGYAEAISAGYYPGKHIMSIPKQHRDVFYKTAREAVEKIIAAEVAYESR